MHKMLNKLSFAVACIVSSGAYAGGMFDALVPPDSAPNLIGLGVGTVPDYLGSNHNRVGVAPMARYQFESSNRFVILLANELDVNLVNDASWRAGPVLNYAFERKDVNDVVVNQMVTRDAYMEYGAYVQYVSVDPQAPRNRWSVGLTGLSNSKDGNKGYRMRLGAQYFRQMSQAVDLNLGAGLWYGDSKWNNFNFGVNTANVGTSGLPMYTAGSGVNQYFVNAGAIMYLSKNWALGAGLRYSHIPGDAGNSPLVGGPNGRGDSNQLIGGVGISYLIW